MRRGLVLGAVFLAHGCASEPPRPSRTPSEEPRREWVSAGPVDTEPQRLPGRAVVVIPERAPPGSALGRPRASDTATSGTRGRPAPRRRVDISLKSADFHNALRLFADTGGFNLVIEDAVGGTVDLELRAVDPYETLVMVAEAKGAAVSVRGSTVVVTGASAREP